MHPTTVTRRALLAVIAVAVLAGACGGKRSDHNVADATFVDMMIPHHAQAVEMAGLAAKYAASPDVKALAARIEAAQGPEIDQMTAWQDKWANSGGMPGMDMGGGSSDTTMADGDGMLSDAAMTKLGKARGNEFDRQFLTGMVSHHQGAIEMTQTEMADGKNADAVALARAIGKAQRAEITEMRDLLDQIGSTADTGSTTTTAPTTTTSGAMKGM